MATISGLGILLKWKDQELKSSLDYIVSLRPA